MTLVQIKASGSKVAIVNPELLQRGAVENVRHDATFPIHSIHANTAKNIPNIPTLVLTIPDGVFKKNFTTN